MLRATRQHTQLKSGLRILQAAQLFLQLANASFSVHGTRLVSAAGGPLISERCQVTTALRVPEPQVSLFPTKVQVSRNPYGHKGMRQGLQYTG